MTDILKNILKTYLIIYLVSRCVSSEDGPTIDYCFVSCVNKDQMPVLCHLYHNCDPSEGVSLVPSTVEFRRQVLDQHNRFRDQIASGTIKGPYGNKGAKDMRALSYDMEMEYLAACFALKREEEDVTNMGCSDTERFSVVHNFHFVGPTQDPTSRAVPYWIKGLRECNSTDYIDRYQWLASPGADVFIRLVTAVTRYVGCAKAKSAKGLWMYCHYGPALSARNKSVYHMVETYSEIGSECSMGRNRRYSSLCGEINPIPTEKMWVLLPSTHSSGIRKFEIYFGPLLIDIVVNYLWVL